MNQWNFFQHWSGEQTWHSPFANDYPGSTREYQTVIASFGVLSRGWNPPRNAYKPLHKFTVNSEEGTNAPAVQAAASWEEQQEKSQPEVKRSISLPSALSDGVPELISPITRSKSVRAVLQFKDKIRIDWCAEAHVQKQALNPFDKKPCLFEKSQTPRNVTTLHSLLTSEGANKLSGYLSIYHNHPYHA